MRAQRAATLAEFAIAWPVALLLILGAVQMGVYSVEVYAARAAAQAGARAGAAVGAGDPQAAEVALRALQPSLVGVQAVDWCPGARSGAPPPVWVCAGHSGASVQVRVGGAVPALVPLPGLSNGLPIAADAVVQSEVFAS